ncbi:hypothetical protein SKP52_15740 [Sphingopyxis fribergensis]|uniref:Uncharacterized protein n=1 Tax=Sphingopyxis fribergensis TaxID=1515612 RepID=A0A0A7PIS8_9SPHN|nr:hypothetical protein [Sphingopyxis fribergensis]AJA10026.1 hypothetical protein SKP52_15740 [Sphingopyxis fribergensis]
MATAFAQDRAPETVIDRTLILSPKQLWPDLAKCPDWPALRPTERYDGPRGKAGAEARLEAIAQYLNRGPGKLRKPTTDECDSEFSRVFRRSGSTWHHLGINELSALGMMTEGEAGLMVEACHLRGYLLKLETREADEVKAKEQQRLSAARRTLESYRADAPARVEEIASLAEAVARHQQRIDDEAAFQRSAMLRQSMEGWHSQAVAAAHELGLSVPDAPVFVI